jgi:3-demethylubiquinone-9 3-methyltransferase
VLGRESGIQPSVLSAPTVLTINQTKTMKLKISPCLWFDTEAEEAARFYTGIFKDSRITAISRYPDAGQRSTGNRQDRC